MTFSSYMKKGQLKFRYLLNSDLWLSYLYLKSGKKLLLTKCYYLSIQYMVKNTFNISFHLFNKYNSNPTQVYAGLNSNLLPFPENIMKGQFCWSAQCITFGVLGVIVFLVLY